MNQNLMICLPFKLYYESGYLNNQNFIWYTQVLKIRCEISINAFSNDFFVPLCIHNIYMKTVFLPCVY